jgi:hypothetical protein
MFKLYCFFAATPIAESSTLRELAVRPFLPMILPTSGGATVTRKTVPPSVVSDGVVGMLRRSGSDRDLTSLGSNLGMYQEPSTSSQQSHFSSADLEREEEHSHGLFTN